MKYTILGSNGFIGSQLVRRFKTRGDECFLPEKGFAFSPAQNLGHVIYCIGLTSDFRSRPMDTVKAHVTELVRVLENSSFESFLYLSSTRVYAGSETGGEEQVLRVNSSDPSDLYNLSKLMGEAICFATGKEQVRVARLSNVVGDDFQSDNFLFSLIREAVNAKEIHLRVPLSSAKDYVSIEDVTEILPKISESGKSRIYNVASGVDLTNQAIVEEIRRLTGCQVKASSAQNSLLFPSISVQRLSQEFGYRPRNVISSLPRLVEEYQRAR